MCDKCDRGGGKISRKAQRCWENKGSEIRRNKQQQSTSSQTASPSELKECVMSYLQLECHCCHGSRKSMKLKHKKQYLNGKIQKYLPRQHMFTQKGLMWMFPDLPPLWLSVC